VTSAPTVKVDAPIRPEIGALIAVRRRLISADWSAAFCAATSARA